MRRLYSFILTLLFVQFAYAQWPANYGGVMLQGFYWDSYEDTKWTNLTAQADELSKYFDLIWVPNSANCVSPNSMGYLPVYWFDHRSSFGNRERYVTEMIAAFNAKGTKVIEDVVINHKNPVGKNGSWIDFADETKVGPVTGETYTVTWSGADICNNDDGGHVKAEGWPVTGANDEGEDFSGSRDLDHTSANVQKNCITYMTYLLKEMGYSGYRLDMVKGYSPYYTKMYNEATHPEFCVGEYWDGNAETLRWWINETGKTSAAFDFSLKFTMNAAISGGSWDALSNKGLAGDPNYSRYAVTFVDNHDTYRDENGERMRNNALAANACILALPGTPCIFLKHWKLYPEAIANMILARKACGITNQSSITEGTSANGGYTIKTQGSKGAVLCLLGGANYPNLVAEGWKLIESGAAFAFYVSSNITVEGLVKHEEDEPVAPQSYTVYVQATTAPNLYAWDANGTKLNGDWPGTEMTETAEVKGTTFWKKAFGEVTGLKIIFNQGDKQTADIPVNSPNSYFTYDGSTGYKDVTKDYDEGGVKPSGPVPACATVKPGHLYIYFKASGSYKVPSVWVYNDTKNFCYDKNWPGDEMYVVGTDTDGKTIYCWDGGEMPSASRGTTTAASDLPTNVIFSNGGWPETISFAFDNGGYYTSAGEQGNVVTAIETIKADNQPVADGKTYNLQGQQVNTSYRGIVIKNGKKYFNK